MRIDAIGSYQQTTDMSTTDTDIATSAKLIKVQQMQVMLKLTQLQ